MRLTKQELKEVLERGKFTLISTVVDKLNHDDHIALKRTFKYAGKPFMEVVGKWEGKSELSFLVLGLTREDAIKTARRFDQNALIWHNELILEGNGLYVRWESAEDCKIVYGEDAIKPDGYTNVWCTDGELDFALDWSI